MDSKINADLKLKILHTHTQKKRKRKKENHFFFYHKNGPQKVKPGSPPELYSVTFIKILRKHIRNP